MATGKLRESNRDNAGDFIGECSVTQSCEPCMKTNVSKTATVFCNNCNEYLCDTCKNPHTVYKPGRHDIVNIQDRKSVPVGVDMKGMDICPEHGKEIEFSCKDHSKLCCSKCVLIHRKCDHVEEIASASEQERPKLQALQQSMIKLQSEAEAIIADCKQSETCLNESIANISSEVDKMRDRIVQLFEEAKKKLITDATQFKSSEVQRIRINSEASLKVFEEMYKVLPICCAVLEHGTPCQQYLCSKIIQEKNNTWQSIINEHRNLKISTKVTVSFPRELSSLLEMGNKFIKLKCCLSSQSMPVTLELLVSVKLPKAKDDEKEPFLTGLDFLPDGRLVVVDNKNYTFIILNERLQKLGTPYKFKTPPKDVVYLPINELAVTCREIVCFLSVSSDNVTVLTREINTSFYVHSIDYMSPSNMVVSTYDDPRPVRMISVDGVESEFYNVKFPEDKTYKKDQSMCMYVQSLNMLVLTDRFANTVHIYDTVKGTSRAVTDENIQQPRGACVGPGDTVLVCSTNKNSIVHLSSDGNILGTYPVDMTYPLSICVSKNGTRLAVSNSFIGKTKLQLYKISPS
ncbi:uncharacterized protein LOC127833573 isoform X2 [Dreissena polymorpha]|uniref:uncharacterized protein LOC127833573 isoform X2 n=1 Tax=Dreissena polymorpha TaxID=45954 RepID=UPI002264CFC1|nr:uncharacterized protein LOC127833573 isoform X2 [Dreissena polymorpha]